METPSPSSVPSGSSGFTSALSVDSPHKKLSAGAVFGVALAVSAVIVAVVLVVVYRDKWFPGSKPASPDEKKYTCDATLKTCTPSVAAGAKTLAECLKTCTIPKYYECNDAYDGTCHLGTTVAGQALGIPLQDMCSTRCMAAKPDAAYVCNRDTNTCVSAAAGQKGLSQSECNFQCVAPPVAPVDGTGGYACSGGAVSTCVALAGGTMDRTCEGSACAATQARCNSATLTCTASTDPEDPSWDRCDTFCRGSANSCFAHGNASDGGCTCYAPYYGDFCEAYHMDFSSDWRKFQNEGGRTSNDTKHHVLWTVGSFITSLDTKSFTVRLSFRITGGYGSGDGTYSVGAGLVALDAVDSHGDFAPKFGTQTGVLTTPLRSYPAGNPTNNNDQNNNYGSVYNMLHDPNMNVPLPNQRPGWSSPSAGHVGKDKDADGYLVRLGLPYYNRNWNQILEWAKRSDTVNFIVEQTFKTSAGGAHGRGVEGRSYAVVVYIGSNTNSKFQIVSDPGQSYVTFSHDA